MWRRLRSRGADQASLQAAVASEPVAFIGVSCTGDMLIKSMSRRGPKKYAEPLFRVNRRKLCLCDLSK